MYEVGIPLPHDLDKPHALVVGINNNNNRCSELLEEEILNYSKAAENMVLTASLLVA